MFDRQFAESMENSAKFPEDNEEAWEGLVASSYENKLRDLQNADFVDLTPHESHDYFNRLKLCCLAEKYDMLLLHGIAIDTLVDFHNPGIF